MPLYQNMKWEYMVFPQQCHLNRCHDENIILLLILQDSASVPLLWRQLLFRQRIHSFVLLTKFQLLVMIAY